MLATPNSNPPATTPSQGLQALLRGAAFAPMDGVGWVRVTGEDRVRWLNGMVTNSIQALTPGEGCYSFVLSAQGRIQGDLTAWILDDSILLETSRASSLATWLDRYIIMDDVELTVLSLSAAEQTAFTDIAESPVIPSERRGLLVAGPQAASALADLLAGVDLPAPMHLVSTVWQSAALDILHTHSPRVPRFELWSESIEVIENIAAALLGDDIPQASVADLEDLRLLEGTPLYGIDIREKELPQETAQARALHFSKGCYLGQEIVERIHSRGAVHRTFSGFVLTGDVPPAGTALATADAPDKSVGELTSTARIQLPEGPITLGLGYIRREAIERGVPIAYNGGSAVATSVPFAASRSAEPMDGENASQTAAAYSQATR